MKICIFNRSYWPEAGATGRLLAQLAGDLAGVHGCEVTMIAGRPLDATAAAAPARERRQGVEIRRVGGTTFDRRRFAGRALNYLTYFASACAAALRAGRPDVAVAFSDPPIIGMAALIAARRGGGAFVLVCQDLFPEVTVLLDDFHSGAVDRVLFRINRALMRRADRIVVVGEAMKRRIVTTRGIDPARIDVIHNWCDRAAITVRPKHEPLLAAHGLAGAFVVMHSGNVGFAQDLDTLLAAAARLRARPEVRLAIVGTGARRAALEDRARVEGLSNVVFIPYQPEERLAETLASADVHVVSMRAGLAGCLVPSKLYGVLAAGRPYVAAVEPDTEVAAIARDTGSGIVVPPGDPAALAGAIVRLLDDPGLVRAMGSAARDASAAYDRPGQVAAYLASFAAAAGVASPHPDAGPDAGAGVLRPEDSRP